MLLRKLFIAAVSAIAGGALLAGCGGSGGGDDGTTAASFSVVDAPVDDADAVVVAFDKIVLYPSDGDPVTFELDEPKTIDLLQHQGSNDEMVFENVEAPPGEYDRIDIYIVDGAPNSYVDDDTGRHNLFVPGNQGAGEPRHPLKLFEGFTLAAGNVTDFVIDFDLRKALTNPIGSPGGEDNVYLLRPSMRLINKLETGTISGTVEDALVMDDSCTNNPVSGDVYLYTGLGASPGDVNLDPATGDPDHPAEVDVGSGDDDDGNTDEVNPLVTAEVTQNGDTGVWEYSIDFVATGDYTIAFTCQSIDDLVDTDEDIELVEAQDVTVQADQEETVNFPAPAP